MKDLAIIVAAIGAGLLAILIMFHVFLIPAMMPTSDPDCGVATQEYKPFSSEVSLTSCNFY